MIKLDNKTAPNKVLYSEEFRKVDIFPFLKKYAIKKETVKAILSIIRKSRCL